MKGFDFEHTRNVWILGAGVSTGAGMPIGNEVFKDIFQKGIEVNDRDHPTPFRYLDKLFAVKKLAERLYNFPAKNDSNDDTVQTIKDFIKEIENTPCRHFFIKV